MPSGSPKWRAVGIFWGVGDEKVMFSGVIGIWDFHNGIHVGDGFELQDRSSSQVY